MARRITDAEAAARSSALRSLAEPPREAQAELIAAAREAVQALTDAYSHKRWTHDNIRIAAHRLTTALEPFK